jgi:hypothetical protein
MKTKYTKYVDEHGKYFYDVIFPAGETLSKIPQSVGDYIHKLEQNKKMYSEEEVRLMLSESFKASLEGYDITADSIIEQLNKE